MGADKSPHALEHYLLRTYGLDGNRLHRLGIFLLAHALIDFHLVAAITTDEQEKRAGPGTLTLDELAAIADVAAKGTFGAHLSEALRRHLLLGDVEHIAEELNRGRIAFQHWERGRFGMPHYEGVDVTTDHGLRRCLDDVLRFIHAVPVITPI